MSASAAADTFSPGGARDFAEGQRDARKSDARFVADGLLFLVVMLTMGIKRYRQTLD
jgi:hypothetical protein